MRVENNKPFSSYLSVKAWRKPTSEKMLSSLKNFLELRKKGNTVQRSISSGNSSNCLTIRKHFSPVDMYCYLKARFGDPNGFVSHTLRNKSTSDNLIHWDFHLKAGYEDILVFGISREIQFVLSNPISDKEWYFLIRAIKEDFAWVSKEKSLVLKSLEKWLIFPNKYLQLAEVCSELHSNILNNIDDYKADNLAIKQIEVETLIKRNSLLYSGCLQLSILTPILAEAFLNMLILMLCKKEIKENKKIFDSFIRSDIHTRISDLPKNCKGFCKSINFNSKAYKEFKKLRNKRNNLLHGNINPYHDKLEVVYFENTVPLYQISGSNIGKICIHLEQQYKPREIINDYENTHIFFLEIVECLDKDLQPIVWEVIGNFRLGYKVGYEKVGVLFPNPVVDIIPDKVKYDDELDLYKI
jgi:hypothetical protein